MKAEKTWDEAMETVYKIMLEEWSKEEIIEYLRCRDGYTKNDMTAIIPTVTVTDAPMVEYTHVVRCKDCKWWINGMCYSDNFILRFEEVKPDWFCADGERKVATVKNEDSKDSGDVKDGRMLRNVQTESKY